MAITERYVTAAAGGGGTGTSGDPWTLTEAFANAVAGDRVNVKADSTYTLSADLNPAASGGVESPIWYRGYSSSIGDGYQGRTNDTGDLDVSNMPVIDCGASYKIGDVAAPKDQLIFETINFTGAGDNYYILRLDGNYNLVTRCKFTATGNSGAAVTGLHLRGVTSTAYNCDFFVPNSGATNMQGIYARAEGLKIVGCKFNTPSDHGIQLYQSSYIVIRNNVFYECNDGIYSSQYLTGGDISQNTFVNMTSDAINIDRIAGVVLFENNMITDNGRAINLPKITGSGSIIVQIHTRTRDNTSADVGIVDWPNYNPITTDTGGQETDYTDASSDDYTLIAASPAVGQGAWSKSDIGAYPNRGVTSSGGGRRTRGRYHAI